MTTTVAAEQLGAIQRVRVDVRLRDGVLLATDIYSPAGTALPDLPPRPVLLERTPYGIRENRRSDGTHADGSTVTPESGAAYFVGRGFVVVRQDCRGRGDSGGQFAKYVGEAADGADTHAWLLAQPWCDGRIATHGVSYSAHTQAAAAGAGAPGIRAMVMDSGGFSNAWEAGGRFGGAFELKQVVWAFRRAVYGGVDSALAGPWSESDLATWFGALPWRKGFSPLTGAPEYEDFVFEQWSHEDFDDFWMQPGLYARGYYHNFPYAPVLAMSSWYDPYVFTTVENFTELRQRHPDTALVLGPWTHGARSVTYAGDVDFGPDATFDALAGCDYLQFKADWISAALEGRHPATVPVSYFLMGGGPGVKDGNGRLLHGGSWRRTTDWPPPAATTTDLFLAPSQRLDRTPSPKGGSISYDFDPRDPVPTIGGGVTSGEPLMRGGAFDQVTPAAVPGGRSAALTGLPVAARRDVVSFQTEPLTEDLVVAGPVMLELDFSSSAPDTDVTAKLVDVYPPGPDYPAGFAMNVTDGMLRCRYRDDPARPELMVPGRVYRLRIRIPDTANRFVAGHRIRLDVSSSNFPRCDVNPNTGEPVVSARTFQVARNTLHLGESRLRLTVLDD